MSKKIIASLLEGKYSKGTAEKIAANIVKGKYKLQDLMDLFFSDDLRVCQHASWPLVKLADIKPELLQPYLHEMVSNMDNPKNHDAVIRNTLRIMGELKIPEDLEGIVLDKCLNFLQDPSAPAAFRAFSITVGYNIASNYPEILQELKAILLDQLHHENKPSFTSRANKILKKID